MRIIVCNKNKLSKVILPEKIEGSFWIKDEFTTNNIINVEAANGKWYMYSNEDAKIKTSAKIDNIANNTIPSVVVENGRFYYIEYEKYNLKVFFENTFDNSVNYYSLSDNITLSFGNKEINDIIYSGVDINDYMVLSYMDSVWKINIKDNSKVFVNDFLLEKIESILNYGDVLFVEGVRMVLYKGMISINNINNNLKVNGLKLVNVNIKNGIDNTFPVINSDMIKEVDYYKESDYFFKKVRIRRFIEPYKLIITSPPNKVATEEMPLILTLGPMISMALISFINLFNIITRILNGETTWQKSTTQLITTIAMLMTSLLWPNLMRIYRKKLMNKKEKQRQKKYRKYMQSKKEEINVEKSIQREILKENLVDLVECQNIILNNTNNLWERRKEHKDYLMVRIGIGDWPIAMEINYTEEDFSMNEDELKKELEMIINEAKLLTNVPIGYSFNNKQITAIIGVGEILNNFVNNILIQLLTFHSYDDLKLVFIVSKKNTNIWEKYKEIFHVFSNDKKIRFYADDHEEAKNISNFLCKEFDERLYNSDEAAEVNEVEEKTFSPHYIIITDDYPMYRNLGIINKILENKKILGFSLIFIENELRRVPSECVDFINVNGELSSIHCNDINRYILQNFKSEYYSNVNFEECCRKLANIPIEFYEDIRYLPVSLGFLEMFNVGKVEQLNTLNRWRVNDPIYSLKAQVGINDEGDPIYLDLHEKYHGPHGLIAGTTGSGKSEFIITYILSLALNYSPNEVAFILIDYKGGGLAGAFENKNLGIKLPHLAGTITNLDKSELNRTLISINSELKKRQAKFNEVRDKLGESTIDIYKYQNFFREKKIDEPMPHLFIISDEFAELKAQQPEFMSDLISAARIGRSLGVHLILATQKPSGVVNDQIWSNSKFRVCLKVQDRSDSNEMLKCPDAANITNAGRFYLQVGNNEIFTLGQSGWSGNKYIPSDTIKRKNDRSISIINDTGSVIKNLEEVEVAKLQHDNGDELLNVLKYICDLASKENLKLENLWLEKLPENIYVDNLIKKYNYTKKDIVTAIIGEYDAPSRQYQNILTLELNDEGNTLIFGSSGANREMFISSLLYSLCITYPSEDINIYVIDYGAESFRQFINFPQIGDMIFPGEDDKLNKLISLLYNDIAVRKKMFADYNGEYKTYNKLSGNKLPLKLLIINNYDTFKETYQSFDDVLVKLTREGERYGIICIISATSGRIIYSKLENNFHNKFLLDMYDRAGYIEEFGRLGNLYPAECNGRGLFKTDEIYEYQTAQICPLEDLVLFLNKKIQKISEVFTTKAPSVPSLPEEVSVEEHLLPALKEINALPIGITRQNLKIYTYNFFNDKATIISSKVLTNCIEFLESIIFSVRKLNHLVILIDGEQGLSSIGAKANVYVDNDFNDSILKIEEFLDKHIDGKDIKVLCIISGLEKFNRSLYDKNAKGFFDGVKTINNLSLIFVDSSFKLKKLGYEPWYTGLVNNINGIWIGDGFLEQTLINSNDYSNKFREKIDTTFAWVTQNGESELIKIVGVKEKQNEE